MKRKIALLLLLIVAVATILTACKSPDPTNRVIRWEDDENAEHYVFHVSLADFNPNAKDKNDEVFNYTQDNENKVKFYKDMGIAAEVFSSLDEICPVAVDGTYTLDIVKEGENWKVSTSQTLYVQYDKESKSQDKRTTVDLDLGKENNPNREELTQFVATAEEIATDTTLTPTSETVILKSDITTETVFADNSTQTPVSSTVSSHGFYIGAAKQQASIYTIKTEYDFGGKRPIVKVKVDDKPAASYKMKRNASFIDPNQLLLYIRSFDKTSSSFADNPSVNVFNTQTGELVAASFKFSYNSPMTITDRTRNETKNVSLNIVTVSLGGVAYMLQENVPDYAGEKTDTSEAKAVDVIAGNNRPRYTTVRFRVGYLAYELNEYKEPIWNALHYKKS